MSRIARKPIQVAQGVELKLAGAEISVKGRHGVLVHVLHEAVAVEFDDQTVRVLAKSLPHPMVGTTFRLIQNMIQGVSQQFERRLQLVGVGYRAKVQGDEIELSLGYSEPVLFKIPAGVSVSIPNPSEIILQGIDNELLGKTAAEICEFRPTEPYKGKGIRLMVKNSITGLWAPVVVSLKQTKKKK
jgi:large subunit ribosomal protein L6